MESLQAAKSSVERQLQETQAAEEQLRSDKGALAQVVARLQGEQEGLVHTVDKLAGEKQAVEAQVGPRSAAIACACRCNSHRGV